MRIFLSYPSEERQLVEPIYLALRAQGHNVFFDRKELPPGEEYDIRIRKAIERADLFVFMLSAEAFDAGSYTLTELEIAQKTWPHPTGRVLPVMLHRVALDKIPPYLEAVTFLEPDGNTAATVADAVYRIASARRKALLGKLAVWLAVAVVVGAGTFMWSTNRQPARHTTGKDGAPAVLVPAGAFAMGDGEVAPLRETYIDAFYIDKYEVTASRYAKFLEATGVVRPPDEWEALDQRQGAELPVVGVDWHDADAYCRWAGRRLPTETEWERAARDTDARVYPWGDGEPTAERARYGQPLTGAYRGGLAVVGSHPAGESPYGADDLAGNASEWAADWYAEALASTDVRNPTGPASGTAKVIRGGGWYDPADKLASARRYFASPDTRSDDIGFRCAADAR